MTKEMQELIDRELNAARLSAAKTALGVDDATARVERVNAALDEKRAEYVAKRDAAALPSTKAIYQAFIDAIDRIKEKLETAGEEPW